MPNQYQLLRHAVTLADQLEAAGCREAADWKRSPEQSDMDGIVWHWGLYGYVTIYLTEHGDCDLTIDDQAHSPFRVGDPLPPDLIAAIKATEGDRA